MDDEAARKTEILKAEEAIRQLAEEMGRAKSAAAAADEVKRTLQEAIDTLRGTRGELGELVAEQKASAESAREAAAETRQAAGAGLSDAAEQIRAALQGVEDAAERLRGATDEASRGQAEMSATLERRLREMSASLGAVAERADQRTSQSASEVSQRMEARFAALSETLKGLARDVEDAKRTSEIKAHEVLVNVRPRLARQTVLVVLVLIFSIAAALGAAALLWQQYAGVFSE